MGGFGVATIVAEVSRRVKYVGRGVDRWPHQRSDGLLKGRRGLAPPESFRMGLQKPCSLSFKGSGRLHPN